ncbi:hypothetical protein VP1G_09568 [Cytospora mali]|uniref:Uncharacterized protein n=1 Tax=Cytospora mali TaxID=578113 RepID=A0A194VEX9_CYTMA|nr:hypothetical protein VP1G_09568 [Valsa mali var. pyri (nom. inval.)]
MHSAQFLVLPSLLLGVATAQTFTIQTLLTEPTQTTTPLPVRTTSCACITTAQPGTTFENCFAITSVDGPKPTEHHEKPCLCKTTEIEVASGLWQQETQCQGLDLPLQSRGPGRTIVSTQILDYTTEQLIPPDAGAGDSCVPQDDVLAVTAAIYLLAESAIGFRQVINDLSHCEVYADMDAANICYIIVNGYTLCQGNPNLPDCMNLGYLLFQKEIDGRFGNPTENVTQVVDGLRQLPESEELCRDHAGEGLWKCAVVTGAVLTCYLGPATESCDELSDALQCRGLQIPRPFGNEALSNNDWSQPGVDYSPPGTSSNEAEPVESSHTQAFAQLVWRGSLDLCDEPQNEEELKECIALAVSISKCLIEWEEPRCQEVVDILDEHGVQVPGVNDGGEDSSERNPLSFLDGFSNDDVDIDLLLEDITDILDSDPPTIPPACVDLCEQDSTIARRRILCYVCIKVVNMDNGHPPAPPQVS